MKKITHVHPQAAEPWCRNQAPIGNGNTEADVWNELRYATLRDEEVLIPVTYQGAKDEVLAELERDEFDRSRVNFLILEPIKKTIQIPPAHNEIRGSKLVRISDDVVVGEHQEKPATTKTITVDRYFDTSKVKHVRHIASKVGKEVTTVVLFEPDVEAGDLDHLKELKNVDVVIFHRLSEKCGVVFEGEVDPENWEEEFPALAACEFQSPEVIVDDLIIKGNITVVAGRFEAYKTMGLIELSDAILSERPAFNHFTVHHRHPIMFLCADMSPELFSDYAAPFDLRKHGTDFRGKNPKANVITAIDSPVLQRAVRDRILILDTMLDFAKIKEAFQSGEWITFMQQLRELMTVHGCIAVVMTAHATKTGAKSSSIDPSEYLKDSVTFGGKIDVGLAFSKLENTSQIFIERIKSRGFKKPLSFTIAVNDDDGNCNFDRGCFPVYLKPGEAGKKEDHVAKDKGGRESNPERDSFTQQITQLKNEGKSLTQIAEQLQLSLSTVKRYSKPTFDADKESKQQ